MNDFSELENPTFAIEYLASNLRAGTLVLFLGSGASQGFGLPDWITLVNSLRREVSLPAIKSDATADDLQQAADDVRDKFKNNTEKLIEAVGRHLYRKVPNLLKTDIYGNHLLISVSALLMGSKRGHVNRVVTLNYDNMLEWLLSLFGFVVKTIYQLPDLEGSEDVRIYHPHGFIPHPTTGGKGSTFIILGMDDANKRLGTPGDPWFEMTRHILNTGVCLFIGMSTNTLSDRAIAPLFKTCGENHRDKRPVGVWILKGKLTSNKRAQFQRNNIVPLPILNVKRISEFLLNICQEAMKKSLSND